MLFLKKEGVRSASLSRPPGIPTMNWKWSQISGLDDCWFIGDGGMAVNLTPKTGQATGHGLRSQVTPAGVGGYGFGGRYVSLPISSFGGASSKGWTFRLVGYPAAWPSNSILIDNPSRQSPISFSLRLECTRLET
jgi:hypothetical protein